MITANHRSRGLLALLLLLLAILSFMISFKPAELPKPWFDEGWTLSAAKNWAEDGAYALRLEDTWISPDAMVQPFTVILPAGVSLRLLGSGIFQARLPGILFTLGTLAVLYLLAQQIYNTRIAWGTLFTVLVLTPNPDFQPVIFGRQALGEMPMLFFLLAGYWFWLQSLQEPRKYMIFAIVCWGLGAMTKRQVLPFWLLSWAIPVVIALVQRQWQVLKITLATGILAGLAVVGFTYLDSSLYRNWPLYGPSIIKDLYSVLFLVWDKEVRLRVLNIVVQYGSLSLIGLLYAAGSLWARLSKSHEIEIARWGELSLVTLALSWLAWFAVGSLGWLRYFAPIFIVSAMFFARFVHDCSAGYSARYIVQSLTLGLLKPDHIKDTAKALIALILVSWGLLAGCISWIAQLRMASNEPYLVANYINSHTSDNALVETYESELLFLMDRRYHYPPPEVQVKVILRTFLKQDVPLKNGRTLILPFYMLFPDANRPVISISLDGYNPLEANPDYIVVGPFGDRAELYDPLLDSNEFALVKAYPNYAIYERVR